MTWWWPNTEEDGKEYSIDDIVEKSAPYIHSGIGYAGIYFLIDCDEIVYVGQSHDVKSRLSTHSNSNKNFNKYYFIKCQPEELNRLEAYYILKFRPKYNISLPKEPV